MADPQTGLLNSTARPSRIHFLWRELGIMLMLVSELLIAAPWMFVVAPLEPGDVLWVLTLLVVVSAVVMMLRRLLAYHQVPILVIQFLTFLMLPISILAVVQFGLYQDGSSVVVLGLRIIRSYAALLQGVSLEVLMTGFVVFAWSRGVRAAEKGMAGLVRTGGMIRWGLLSYLALLIILEGENNGTRWFLTAYFLATMLAAAMSRTDSIARSHLRFKLPMHTGWLAGIVVLTLLTIGIGVMSGYLLSSEAVQNLMGWFGGLFDLLVRLVEVLAAPVLYFFGVLFSILLRWLRPFINEENMFAPQEGLESDIEGMPFGDTALGQDGTLSPEFVTGLTIVSVLLVAVMVMWGMRRGALRRDAAAGSMQSDQDPDSLFKSLQRLYENFRERMAEVGEFKGIRRFLVESNIRRIYAQMLRFGARQGIERRKSETPYEFQLRLVRRLPHLEKEFDCITSAYVDVRYGEFPEGPEAIQAVRDAWDHVKSLR